VRPAIAAIDRPAEPPQTDATAVVAARSFTNPTTNSSYRLRVDPQGYRITRSRSDQERVRLTHLRGAVGPQPLPAEVVGAFIRGDPPTSPPAADPVASFNRIVLTDLDMTAGLLTALARDAQHLFDHGRPGFRPGCALFRRQRDDAFARAMVECLAMTQAWMASGIATTDPLPDWLASGVADARRAATRPPGPA
jgi:hypothetical protein